MEKGTGLSQGSRAINLRVNREERGKETREAERQWEEEEEHGFWLFLVTAGPQLYIALHEH